MPRDDSRAKRPRTPIPEPDEAETPPRYAAHVPLPRYRFVPGLDPHPTRDPDGHSFGAAEPTAQYLPPEEWRRNAEYLYGVDLFNRRFYWEAHEAWESVWRASAGDVTQRQFIQGLILIAAALLQWFMGSPAGVLRQRAKAIPRLSRALNESPDDFMGVALARWLPDVERRLERLAALPPGKLPARMRLPVITLSRYNDRVFTPPGG